MRRILVGVFVLLVATISVFPVAAAEPEAAAQPDAFEQAIVWKATRPGFTLLGAITQGIIAETNFGFRLINSYDRSFTEIPLPGISQITNNGLLFCDQDQVAFWENDLTFEATAAQLGYEAIADCLYIGASLFVLGELNGENFLTQRSTADLPNIRHSIDIPNPVSLEFMNSHIGLVIDSAGDAFEIVPGVEDPKPYDGPREFLDVNTVRRTGNTITETSVFDGRVMGEYTLPEGAQDLMAVDSTRMYLTELEASRSQLTTFGLDTSIYPGSRTLDLPFVPDSYLPASRNGTFLEYEDGVYIEQGDTIYVVTRRPVVQSVSHTEYENGSGESVEVKYWSVSGASSLYIRGYPLAVSFVEGGFAFVPILIRPGTHSVSFGSVPLFDLTFVGWPPSSDISIQVPAVSFDRSVDVSCQSGLDPFSDVWFSSRNQAKEKTLNILNGVDCSFSFWEQPGPSDQRGSWGFYSDGVLHDFLGNSFTMAASGDISMGLRYRDPNDAVLWLYVFRSGGHLAPTREVQTACFDWRGRKFEQSHTVSYEIRTRLVIDNSQGYECYIVAEGDDNSDLTALWKYHDFGEPVDSGRVALLMDPSRPAWYDIGELIVHPNDDTGQFVIQQYQDFLGRAPTGHELYAWSTDIDSGKQSRAKLSTALVTSAEYGNVADPNIRLYRAFFDRLPDSEGLLYWMNVRRGGHSIELVSDQFVLSQEFVNAYGDTTDTEFISLVYENVLKRQPDAAGYSYWEDLLTTGKITRGELMIYFSESVEYRNTWAPTVQVVRTYIALLGRVPTDAELAFEVDRIRQGVGPQELVQVILGGDEYDQRFWDHYRGARVVDLRADGDFLLAGAVPSSPREPGYLN